MTGQLILRLVLTRLRELNTWWVWTARPAIFHPVQTIKDQFRREPVSEDDLAALTPEERKALK